MSKQAAVQFLEKMESDKAFKEMFMKAKEKEERMAIQRNENFLFTKDELLEGFQEKYHKIFSKEKLEKIVTAGPEHLLDPSFLSSTVYSDS